MKITMKTSKMIPFSAFMKAEAMKELNMINAKIDKLIQKGKSYKTEARIHKELLAITNA